MEAEANRAQQGETIEQYFRRTDSPSENSPVGVLMLKVIEKFPGISFEDARAKSKKLLSDAGRRRNFRMPVVLTEQEMEDQKARIRLAFQKVAVAA